jgi:hypothetical protein
VIASQVFNDTYLDYVTDSDDAQIIQDCIESGCNHLLTNNTKDFNITQIQEQFSVWVIDHL